jgi:ABC-2 type transport system ATP-binding protein
MTAMIEFDQVSRSYGSKVAVDKLNLQVQAGEIFALLGHNGAGKTTTIKMLVSLLRPESGKVRVGGFDLVTQPREATALIGYVPDEPYLYDKLTGREFLHFVAELYGASSDRAQEQVLREIERFELHEFIDYLTESYSHGMKQRTVLASAMLHSPAVLVVDEPMIGLDPPSIRLVKDLFRSEAAAGMCVFMSTHTLGAVEEIADRIGIMCEGRLLFDGTLNQLRRDMSSEGESLESLYLRMTRHATAAKADAANRNGDVDSTRKVNP